MRAFNLRIALRPRSLSNNVARSSRQLEAEMSRRRSMELITKHIRGLQVSSTQLKEAWVASRQQGIKVSSYKRLASLLATSNKWAVTFSQSSSITASTVAAVMKMTTNAALMRATHIINSTLLGQATAKVALHRLNQCSWWLVAIMNDPIMYQLPWLPQDWQVVPAESNRLTNKRNLSPIGEWSICSLIDYIYNT